MRDPTARAQTSALSGAVDLSTLPSRRRVAFSTLLAPQERGHVEGRAEIEVRICGALVTAGPEHVSFAARRRHIVEREPVRPGAGAVRWIPVGVYCARNRRRRPWGGHRSLVR